MYSTLMYYLIRSKYLLQERVRVGGNTLYVNVLSNQIKIPALGKIRKKFEQVVIHCTSMYCLIRSKYVLGKIWKELKKVVIHCTLNVLSDQIKIPALGKIRKECEQVEIQCTSLYYLIRSKYLLQETFGKSYRR